MEKIQTIISKEWAEVFKNRLVLFSVAFLPLVFIAVPVVTVVAAGSLEGAAMEEFGGEGIPGAETLCQGMNAAECGEVFMLNIYSLMFMILPVAIPVTIAAYSIVGEKTTRSLEPLLATPITTSELLAGKALAAIIPAVVATWVSYLIYVALMRYLASAAAFRHLLDPLWLIAIFIVGPLLTLLAVSVATMISARVSDPRVAEQLSMVVIVPLILAIVGQSTGLFLFDRQLILIAAVVVALLDAVLLVLTVQAFQRETILTRWK
ncbi:MAG: ABC transporter permease subunit [Candidatus Promineifilaceae bacterium]|nr:ABC transporter permease subunit [Candidatus Promineifilaceae bacterium]